MFTSSSQTETAPRSAEAAPPRTDRLSEAHFSLIARLVLEQTGISLPPAKRLMVEGRIRQRVKALGLASFAVYCKQVAHDPGDELVNLIDVVTTNKTDFFREPSHFEFLTGQVLPELEKRRQSGVRLPFRIWSAGCSSGEEPYTMAIVLSEYAAKHLGPYYFSILATDISTRALEKAHKAIYPLDVLAPIPEPLKKKYLLRSKDPASALGRIVPELRHKVEFRRINFVDDTYAIGEPVDVAFCRNVLIYFERPVQQAIVSHLLEHVLPGGYLFVGHSETLNQMDLPLEPVVPTVYRKVR